MTTILVTAVILLCLHLNESRLLGLILWVLSFFTHPPTFFAVSAAVLIDVFIKLLRWQQKSTPKLPRK